MKAKCICMVGLFMLLVFVSSAPAQEPVYWEVVDTIMEDAFEHSEVMENVSWLADVFGPRNVKTPSYRAAAEWARDRLKEYGLTNARLEPYEFGTGWNIGYTSAHMMSPQYMPLIAYPAPWSSGTEGKIRAHVVYINVDEITLESDLDRYRGTLGNAIVFISPKVKLSPHFEPIATKFTEEQLDEMAKIPIAPTVSVLELYLRRQERTRPNPSEGKLTSQQIMDFVFAEGAAAIAHPDSRHDFGNVSTGRYNKIARLWDENAEPQPTELVLAAEQYNRIMRILEKKIPVEMEIEIRTNFFRGDTNDHNVIAEIRGTDLADEIVVLGGHLQSVPVGTGATDNAAGAATAMEVMRIFKKLGIKPRRTVRVGFWGGHDGAGLAGNRSHVRKNFADPNIKEYKRDYHNLSAYFNVDHGTGKIRAVSVMGNQEIRSIFSEWMKPLNKLGMSHLIPGGMSIGGNLGYHDAYAEVGLPGFYFYQDRLDMETNAHTTMDMFDRLVPENTITNVVILATFVYHAAMRDEKLPRIAPLPW
jgi:carboxypeptidase Q